MAVHLTTVQLPHLPEHSLHIAFFTGVTNAATLRAQLLAGNPEFEYAFIDASTIVSTTHVLAAAHQALRALLITQKLRTHNVHSETVYALSPNKNISEAFRRFGVADITSALLAVKISTLEKPAPREDVERHLQQIVDGSSVEFTDEALLKTVDWQKTVRYYKLGTKTLGRDGKAVAIKEWREAEVEVLGKMVMRVVG